MADVLTPNPLTSKPTDVLVKDAKPKAESTELQGLTSAQKGVLQAEEEQAAYKQFGEQTKREQESILSEGKVAATEKYAKEREPTDLKEQLDTYVKEQSKPFIPTEKTAGDLGLIFTLTNIIGFAIGGGAKGSAQAALAAQNGMLEGYQKGDMDAYKKQKDIFEQNQKALARAVEGLKYELAQAEKTASVDKDLAMAQAEKAAVTYGGDAFKEYVKKNGIPKSAEYAKSLEAMQFKNSELQQKAVHDANQLTMQKAKLGIEQARLAEDKRHHIAEETRMAVGKIDREVLNEATKYYPGLEPANLTNLSKAGVERIVGGLETIKSIESVADYIKQHPEAVGATAKIKNAINLDAIKSITGDDQASADAKEKILNDQIDNAIAKGKLSSDEARSAKVLNKMLFSVALSDVKSSGQRGSIYLDKAFQGLYDQASKLGTLTEILHKRIEESDRRLSNVDMNVENRIDKDAFQLTTKGSDQWMQENFPVYTPAQIQKGLKDGTIKNGMWFRGTDDIPRQINLGGK